MQDPVEIGGLLFQRLLDQLDLHDVVPNAVEGMLAVIGDSCERDFHQRAAAVKIEILPFKALITPIVGKLDHPGGFLRRTLAVGLLLRRHCQQFHADQLVFVIKSEGTGGRPVYHADVLIDDQHHGVL
ncbi:MAG: hypothetical protein B6D77_03450 [gamma proteobacterium symbiont of Ctena orbiculata]|nr:MAG: hypothetical protein B6D77_03450 [gamma proteobacterium symbiont of Ctena orbiculata]